MGITRIVVSTRCRRMSRTRNAIGTAITKFSSVTGKASRNVVQIVSYKNGSEKNLA